MRQVLDVFDVLIADRLGALKHAADQIPDFGIEFWIALGFGGGGGVADGELRLVATLRLCPNGLIVLGAVLFGQATRGR